jgi:hypothetical protein
MFPVYIPTWSRRNHKEKTDGWPSGLRRCLKEFVPAVFGRGFESHFIQYFCFLLLKPSVSFVVANLTPETGMTERNRIQLLVALRSTIRMSNVSGMSLQWSCLIAISFT